MKKKRAFRKTALALTILLLAGTVGSSPVWADDYDASKKVSISVELPDIETSYEGVELSCYQVAEAAEGAELSWVLLQDYKESGVDINHLQNSAASQKGAQTLAEIVKEKKIQATSAAESSKTGFLEFQGLNQGVYLLVMTKNGNYGTMAPFLAAVPYTAGGTVWKYEIQAKPKAERLPPKPTETPEPTVTPTPVESDGNRSPSPVSRRNGDVPAAGRTASESKTPAKTSDETPIEISLLSFGASAFVILLIGRKLRSKKEE